MVVTVLTDNIELVIGVTVSWLLDGLLELCLKVSGTYLSLACVARQTRRRRTVCAGCLMVPTFPD